jgi:heme/copper-type cytochrome/quinol oxidase subunit 4
MDPFAHHNRSWMRKQKQKQSKKITLGLTVSMILAFIALWYAVTGKEDNAILYAVSGLIVSLLTAKFGDRE